MTKSFYLWCALALFITELLIAIYVPSRSFIRHAFGDFLVVITLYCLIKGVVNIPSTKLIIAVLLFAFAVEFAQFFHIIDVLGIENKVLRIAIGNSFSWNDLLMYSLGCLLIYLLNTCFLAKRTDKQHS